MTATENTEYGTQTIGADSDGQGGYVRGIFTINRGNLYIATTGAYSKHFKTLKGAVRYMERMGYDAYGRRIG